MKKGLLRTIEWIAVLVLITGFSGCAGGDEPMFNEEDLKTKSIQLSVEMAEGSMENTVAEFTGKMAENLDRQDLETSWNQAVEELGAYKTVASSVFMQKGDKASVAVVLQYEHNGLRVTFMYDENEKIEGLWINYANGITPLADTETYKEEPVKIGSGEFRLDGRLTIPKKVKNPPVVILVQGSGQTDMDETIGAQGNKPFQDLAYGLAENGIASIRYNKRYYQYPETATETITVQDEVLKDVDLAIEMASRDRRLDSAKIYVLGHSLGGMLAPEIAGRNQLVSGIIVLAGTPRKLEEVILQQNKDAVEAMNDKTPEEKKALIDGVILEVEKIRQVDKDTTHTTIMGVNSEYWFSLNQINIPEILEGLRVPMLFLQGEEDFQVGLETDFDLWKKILAGRPEAQFISYPGLNHLFMTTNGLTDIREYDVKGKVEETVIHDISQWIQEK